MTGALVDNCHEIERCDLGTLNIHIIIWRRCILTLFTAVK